MQFTTGLKWKEKWDRAGRWHKWFAWYPVPLDEGGVEQRWAWLETIERKSNWHEPYHTDGFCWYWRSIEKD